MDPKMIDIKEIETRARSIRRLVIEMLAAAGSGHPGGSLSAADIVACLYFGVMRHRPNEPFWEDRDRFILSKGRACPVFYAALSRSGGITHYLPASLSLFRSPLEAN